jgi:hypothetical protein
MTLPLIERLQCMAGFSGRPPEFLSARQAFGCPVFSDYPLL